MTVILDSYTIDQGLDVWQGLRDQVNHLIIYPRTKPSEVLARCAGASLILTNKVKISAEHLAALPNLRYIGVMATGTNVVDLAAAQARGVVVTNVPGYSTSSVAQLVWAFILHLSHHVDQLDAQVKQGRWSASPDFCFFTQPLIEVSGKTLLIVGMGEIGRATAKIAEAFGLRVLSAQVPGSNSSGRLPLREALPQADYISLHCPLTPATQNLVNHAFLSQLKPSAVLINTGRGPLIDQQALVQALHAGHLGGVALDVFPTEPPPTDDPLLAALAQNPPWAHRVVITPHIAWATVEARARLVHELARNVQAFLQGQSRNRVF